MRMLKDFMDMRRLVLAAGFAVLTVLVAAPGAHAESTADTYRQLKLFGDVFEKVRADYVEEVSDQELLEAAINGMLSSLDPHSGFLDLDSFQDMREQTKGEFGGLGIEVTMENGLVKVVAPIDDTPAARANLQAGDLITHLDGDQVMGLTLSEAVERMRGRIGTDIKLTVLRREDEGGSGTPFDVTITRDRIQVQSVRSRIEDDIGYIRITSFTEQTQPGLNDALNDLSEEGGEDLLGFVLDLRNNPGGLLEQAISVADTFLEQGEIVSTRSRHEESNARYNARPGDRADGKPIVVLINGGSASASEIVAGALQDHRRAIILGTPSFGKGSVQTIVPIDDVAIRLTTARYYTPSGRSIQAKGIDPDIEVPLARIETLGAGGRPREADLRGALDVSGEESEDGETVPEAADAEAAAEAPPVDYQLARAKDLIRGVSLFGARVVN